MNDRELLEAAAKAAGFKRTRYLSNGYHQVHGWHEGFPDDWEYWDPLTDDGDALRLAVNLGIEPGWYRLAGYASARAVPASGNVIRIEEYGSDAHAATRRAIVRVAALMYKGN